MNGGRFKLSGFLCAQVFLLFVAALVADKAQGEEGVLIAAFGDSLSSVMVWPLMRALVRFCNGF